MVDTEGGEELLRRVGNGGGVGKVGSGAMVVAVHLVNGIAEAGDGVERGEGTVAGIARRGVANEARTAEIIEDEVMEGGDNMRKSKRVGVASKSAEEDGASQGSREGGGAGGREMGDMVDEEFVGSGVLHDTNKGLGGCVECGAHNEHRILSRVGRCVGREDGERGLGIWLRDADSECEWRDCAIRSDEKAEGEAMEVGRASGGVVGIRMWRGWQQSRRRLIAQECRRGDRRVA